MKANKYLASYFSYSLPHPFLLFSNSFAFHTLLLSLSSLSVFQTKVAFQQSLLFYKLSKCPALLKSERGDKIEEELGSLLSLQAKGSFLFNSLACFFPFGHLESKI